MITNNKKISTAFDELRQFLQNDSGLLLGENKQYLVASRLNRLMQNNNIPSLEALMTKIRGAFSQELKQSVIDAMTTNETLWLRDQHPFHYLRDHLLPKVCQETRTHTIRIWSAACSTGQEPYSISMMVDQAEKTGKLKKKSVQIIATDISKSVLEQAKRGYYADLAMERGLNQDLLKHYFIKRASGEWEVKPEIRSRVEFKLLNLKENFLSLGFFDIVFCRNVLIYFSPELKEDILTRIHKHLNPGGALFLGASESMSNLASRLYRMERYRPGLVYLNRT